MSRQLDAFDKRMKDLAATYARSPRDVVAASARTYTTSIRSSIAAVAPSGRLRGVGKWNGGNRPGARIGVTTKFRGSAQVAKAFVQATGPIQLIEKDTAAHDIPRTTGSRSLRTPTGRLSKRRESTGVALSGRKILNIGGVPVMGPVHHPGTKGKHPFERGVNAAERAAFNASIVAIGKEISKVLK